MISFSIVMLLFAAYLAGSLSSAIVISRLLGLPDPRSEGSNNPGATNVLRLGGKKAAAAVLVIDILKGTLPVILGHIYQLNGVLLALIGLAAITGHIYPLYYQFKGGKGVATALGVYYGLNPLLGLLCSIVWLLSVKIFQYSSLSSLIMVACAPLLSLFFFHSYNVVLPLLLIALFVIVKHKENINRLITHTESKTRLFQKKTSS